LPGEVPEFFLRDFSSLAKISLEGCERDCHNMDRLRMRTSAGWAKLAIAIMATLSAAPVAAVGDLFEADF